MKRFLFIALLMSSSTVWAVDADTIEYCKHKYEQVTLDKAFEDAGCKFSKKTQAYIDRNLQNTYLNCSDYLTDKDRLAILKESAALARIAIKSMGKQAACEGNASFYPAQIYK